MTKPSTPFPLPVGLLEKALAWINTRVQEGSDPQAGAQTFEALDKVLQGSITVDGIGGLPAFSLFTDVVVPSARPFDHPTSLSFVASAPTPGSLAFDAALSAAEIFAGNWDGGSGAIYAENQALQWLIDLAGLPKEAGGVFVSGGTLGNLSALHVARSKRESDLGSRPVRWKLLASGGAHSSIAAAARVMDVDLVLVEADEYGRMKTDALAAAIQHPEEIFAVVANAGATNSGAVDDLEAIAALCGPHGIWLHVDGAYGLAALASPTHKKVFAGIEHADSFIVDPHKWLFAPYDSCALVYREPRHAALAHTQKAEYLEVIDKTSWNPSDFAIHLTRRARGLPLWFSLATYGTNAYAQAIDTVMQTADEIAKGIDALPHIELVIPPQLSVILFRCPNMSLEQMRQWAESHRRSGELLCLPTFWDGEPVFRICVVNPATEANAILNTLATLTP
ncbi:MAG: glutamate/tyrosine decarboxylase-like PLP-dependent enzyme [Saprospiraceae bacterium]|jgi:glutamate/tyrosine decarboxylase-like PLP-dependent enzyme